MGRGVGAGAEIRRAQEYGSWAASIMSGVGLEERGDVVKAAGLSCAITADHLDEMAANDENMVCTSSADLVSHLHEHTHARVCIGVHRTVDKHMSYVLCLRVVCVFLSMGFVCVIGKGR